MRPSLARLYQVVTSSTAPVWLALILAPRSRLARRLAAVAPALAAGLGAVYGGLLVASSRDGERVDFRSADSVRAGLASGPGFVAGWTHMVALDLVAGRWIWETGLTEGRSTRVALLLTWFTGPLGVLWFAAQRRLRPRPSTSARPTG